MTAFDDFLGLGEMDLSPFRTIIFHGRSGSGKSTAIAYLKATTFPDAQVVDEITTYRDLLSWIPQGIGGDRLLVATHVAPQLVRLIAPKPSIVFHTDIEGAKIARHLARRGVPATPRVIDEYIRAFKATYTDAELIIERWPAPTFDQSFARYRKFGRIE